MIKDFFIKLESKENGKYIFKAETLYTGKGTRGEEDTHFLTLKYKGCQIKVIYKLGVSNVGLITCDSIEAKDQLAIKPFEIYSISHLFNLFLRKNNRLAVRSKDLKLKRSILNSKEFIELCKISKALNFSPIIYNKAESEKIVAEYFLEFKDNILVIEPIIAFYKCLIDNK